MRLVLQAVLLSAVYLAVLGSTDWVDAVVGLVVGLALLAALRPSRPSGHPLTGAAHRPSPLVRVLGGPWLLLGLLGQVAGGIWDVGLRVVGVRPAGHGGEVVVPMGERTPVGVVVSAVCFGFAPGGMVLEIDEERRELLVHVMDARDPDGVRADLERFYVRYQRHAFP